MNLGTQQRFSLLQEICQRTMVRWWVVGLSFIGIGMGILYALVDVLRLPLVLGSIVGAEVGTVLRFLVNDRWVFGYRFPTWKRLWQYHVANASGFVIWWGVTNLLPRWGIHYLLATMVGMGASAGWSMVTNFLWVWRRKPPAPPMRVPSS